MDKTIGILGGVGPSATAYLHQEIINLCQKLYGAIHDHEYPSIIVSSKSCGVSEKGVNSYNKNKVREEITEQVKKLVSMDVDIIIPACNTLDIFYKDIQEITNIQVISLPGSVKNKIENDDIQGKIGVLSSEATNFENMYEDILGDDDIVTEKTINYITQRVNKNVFIKNRISLLDKIKEKHNIIDNTIDVIDARDFLIGSSASGLTTKLPNNQICRAPYLLPYVTLRTRALAPVKKEPMLSRSIWELNYYFHKNSKLRVCDCDNDNIKLWQYLGFSDQTFLVDICEWHLEKL